MDDDPRSDWKLVVATDETRCLLCGERVSPFMLDTGIDHPIGGRPYRCRFCARKALDALEM